MEFKELLENLRFEYWATYAAVKVDDEANHTNDSEDFVSFYDFLLRQGFTRFKLSAHGIGRNVQA